VRWECDREAAIPLGRSLLVPDGYLVYRVGPRHLHAFLEIDRGTEHVRAIEEMLGRYQDLYRGGAWRDRHPIWPFTLVVAETAVRAAQLRAIAAVAFGSSAPRWSGLASSFHFGTLSDVTGPNGPLGPIWGRIAGSAPVALAPERVGAVATASPSTNTALAPRVGEAAP